MKSIDPKTISVHEKMKLIHLIIKYFQMKKELDQVTIDFERVENDFELEQNEINQIGNNNINLRINGFESNKFLDWLPL